MKLNPDTYTPEQLKAVRLRVEEFLATEGIGKPAAADRSGMPYGTLTNFLADTYTGNNTAQARKLEAWLDSEAERKTAVRAMPKGHGFVMTETVADLINAMVYAQAAPDMALIVGVPGIGKTEAARHYAQTRRNVWLMTMTPSTGGVNGMFLKVMDALGIVEKSPSRYARAIGAKLEGTGGLLIFDEAHNMKREALEEVRSFHDLHGIGVALIGNHGLIALLEGKARTAETAQLFGRIGRRIVQNDPRPADVAALIRQWSVTEARTVKLLTTIANKPGGLRMMVKTLRVASVLAAGSAGDEVPTVGFDQVKAAYGQQTATIGGQG